MLQGGSRGGFLSKSLAVSFRFVKAGLPSLPVAVLTAGFAVSSSLPTLAQSTAGDIQVVIAPVVRVPTAAESTLRIEIVSRTGVPNRSMLLIKGLPSAISLSQGRLFESGTWAVPLANIGDLRMISGSGPVARTDFSVSLVTVSGDILAQSASSLVVVPLGQPLEVTAAVHQADGIGPPEDSTAPGSQITPPALSGKALDNVMLFMTKGDEHLKSGNLNTARMFYTQAAEQGWAEGAMALAATYDPAELSHMRIAGGIKPDPALAKRWYETAIQLGSKSAEERLQRLTGR